MATEELIREDYYSILHIPQSSPLEQIRDSYKKLALQHHPDKNSSPNATREFQAILRAWECLKDAERRAEYDRNYWVVKIGLGIGANTGSAAGGGGGGFGGGKRKWEWDWEDEGGEGWNEGWAGNRGAADEARRRREEVDRDASQNFRDEGRGTGKAKGCGREKAARANAERRGRARAWKVMARQDHLKRLAKYNEKKAADLEMIAECETKISRYEKDLEKQMRESDAQITRRFYETAARSKKAGAPVKDEHIVLKKLLNGRKAYATKLIRAIEKTKSELEGLRDGLRRSRKKYEEEEMQARQERIREALGILGPRDLKSPLFSMIDRRGQAINKWKALARVKAAVDVPDPSLHNTEEGPFHVDGTWKRVVGEQTCGRCQQSSFQVIPDCAAAECPGCKMIACNACCRALILLREYSDWLSCPGGEMEGSLLSLEFDLNDKAMEFGDTSGFNYFGFGVSHM